MPLRSSLQNNLTLNTMQSLYYCIQRFYRDFYMYIKKCCIQLFGHMQHSYYFTYMEYGLLTIQYPERSWQLLRCPQIYWGSEVGCISRVSSDCLTISMNEYLYYISTHIHGISSLPVSIICFSKNISDLIK